MGVPGAGSRSASGAKRHMLAMVWAPQPSGCIGAQSLGVRWMHLVTTPASHLITSMRRPRYNRSVISLFIRYFLFGLSDRTGSPDESAQSLCRRILGAFWKSG